MISAVRRMRRRKRTSWISYYPLGGRLAHYMAPPSPPSTFHERMRLWSSIVMLILPGTKSIVLMEPECVNHTIRSSWAHLVSRREKAWGRQPPRCNLPRWVAVDPFWPRSFRRYVLWRDQILCMTIEYLFMLCVLSLFVWFRICDDGHSRSSTNPFHCRRIFRKYSQIVSIVIPTTPISNLRARNAAC